MSLGFEQAGFKIACAVEYDPVHACVHHFNFPQTATLPLRAQEVGAELILDRSGLPAGAVDVVIGGPPCQGFSMMGKRALNDPRNELILEYVRIVDELRPQHFVFENVKGLTIGKHREILLELVAEFASIGYTCATPWKVLNAANFGVPQSRERLFLVGSRDDLPLPAYPTPTHAYGKVDLAEGAELEAHVSAREALEDIPDVEGLRYQAAEDRAPFPRRKLLNRYNKEMRCTDQADWHFGRPRIWDRRAMTSCAPTDHTEISRRRFRQTDPGRVEPISRLFKLHPDGVCNTLRAGSDSARGAFTSPRPIHYAFNRCLTVREMARLQGFPDWFRFNQTKWHGARQIGNSVPPPLARAIASKLLEAIGHRPRRLTRPITLGDRDLLKMGMNDASEHWGIPVPISGRTHKSGSRKRSQAEIELSQG